MNRFSCALLAGLALAALPAFGQAGQAPRVEEEGFFRPLPGVVTRSAIPAPAVAQPAPEATAVAPPNPLIGTARDAGVAAIVEAVDAQAIVREAAQRELDRSEQEHARAQAEAARQPPPVIASPLDGTAPITSPLDGTAPIVSPIGR